MRLRELVLMVGEYQVQAATVGLRRREEAITMKRGLLVGAAR
jgi:hypothetical protein